MKASCGIKKTMKGSTTVQQTLMPDVRRTKKKNFRLFGVCQLQMIYSIECDGKMIMSCE